MLSSSLVMTVNEVEVCRENGITSSFNSRFKITKSTSDHLLIYRFYDMRIGIT